MTYGRTAIRILFLILFAVLVARGKIFLWLAIYGVSLLVALLFGRIYCGYICPMNTLMRPTAWISKKLGIQSNRVPRWLKSGKIPWIALVVSIVGMILLKRVAHIDVPILFVWLVVSILVTLRYEPFIFHNLLCPFEPLQRVFGRFARFSKKVDPSTCTGCKLCEKVCPSNAVKVVGETKKAVIAVPICHQCSNCSDICPVNAIQYKGK